MPVEHEENTITIDLPQQSLAPIAETPEAFANEMRLAAAMLWYTQGRVSDEQAAQYAGLSRISFIDAFAAARLPAFRFGTDELWEEVYPAAQAAGGRGRMAGVEPGGLLTASQESGVDVSFAPEAAEEHYRPLGRLKGDLAPAPTSRRGAGLLAVVRRARGALAGPTATVGGPG